MHANQTDVYNIILNARSKAKRPTWEKVNKKGFMSALQNLLYRMVGMFSYKNDENNTERIPCVFVTFNSI